MVATTDVEIVYQVMQVNRSKYLYQWNTGKRDMYVLSFGSKEQLLVMLQNVNVVNNKRTRIAAASSVCVTRPNINNVIMS